MKLRTIKKHNNQNYMNGIYQKQAAPEYAHGLKVYQLGYYEDIRYNDKTTWFIVYSSKPFAKYSSVYYNQVARMKRTGHSYEELITGEITRYNF